jgi:hypothetical protein
LLLKAGKPPPAEILHVSSLEMIAMMMMMTMTMTMMRMMMMMQSAMAHVGCRTEGWTFFKSFDYPRFNEAVCRPLYAPLAHCMFFKTH